MKEYEIRNALIKSTQLGVEDHGIFTFWLHLDYGDAGQGFGGYDLMEVGVVAIKDILSVVGVRDWESLPGKPCRVTKRGGLTIAIGNYIADRWWDVKGQHGEDARD